MGCIYLKSYFIFTKKRLFTVFAFLVCVAFISYEIFAVNSIKQNAKSNDERLAFIKNMGYTVTSDNPSKKMIIIPEVFGDVYNNYNVLQQSAGYDLLMYKGCEATVYTYNINAPENHKGECVLNIIVYNDRVIGGDVSSLSINGFMLPLNR